MPITYSVTQINTKPNCSMLGFCYFFLSFSVTSLPKETLHFHRRRLQGMMYTNINPAEVTSPFAVQPALWLLRQYIAFFVSTLILLIVKQHCLPCFHFRSVSYHDCCARCFVQWCIFNSVCSEQSSLESCFLTSVKLPVTHSLYTWGWKQIFHLVFCG